MQKIAHVKPFGDVTIIDKDKSVHYPYRKITSSENEVDIWEMAKRRYKRAIRIFRKRIDAIISEVYPTIPLYRDEDVSDLLSVMGNNKENPKLPEMLFDLIKKKENVRKENNKKRTGQEKTS